MTQFTAVLLLLQASAVCFLASASVLDDTIFKAAGMTCGLRPANWTQALRRLPFNLLSSRIVGGRLSVYGEHPWQARISGGCGGIIIDEYWVLSAAHCFLEMTRPEDVVVYVGELSKQEEDDHEQSFRVEKLFRHDHYNRLTKDYDVALLKLKPVEGKGIQFDDYVQPACLPEADTPYTEGKMCLISGWGRLNFSSAIYPTMLQAAEVPLFNDQLCSELYRASHTKVTPRMVCAGFMEGKVDACESDSGGPLVCKEKGRYTVMGITSWGEKCALPRYPGVYARVTEFLPWIAQKMKQ